MSVFAFNFTSGSSARRLFNFFIILTILWLPGCGGSSGGTTTNTGSGSSNLNPVAVDDNAVTTQDTPVNINVVMNDNDPDGILQNSGVTIVSAPANGNTTANPDGTVTYTPNTSFTGPTDTFTYTVIDAQNAVSNIATVTVTINVAPVAVDDTALTIQATPVTINVIANDNDADGSIQANGITILTMPANGNAIVNVDGTVTYIPNGTFTGPADSFTYSVTDDLGTSSNIATVTVDINIPPVAVADNVATTQATPIDINVIGNDSDPDGTIQANSIAIISMPTNGMASANANGTVTYTPDAMFTGPSDSFTYQVRDGQGAASNTTTVTIIINARPVAVNDTGLANQATPTTINVIANDIDPDGTIQANSVTIAAMPANGSAMANPDGTVTYTPDPAFTGPTDTFTYNVSDNQNAISNVAMVTININLAPLAAGSCSTTPQETPLAGTLPGTDPDNTPGGLMYFLEADGLKGSVTITATTGAFTYTPTVAGLRGKDTFSYRVEDTEGGVAVGVVTVIIDPKIMPLGDSITQGIVNNFTPASALRTGYRKTLYNGLTADGFNVDFVGSRSIGVDATGFDPDTDSFAGALAGEIANGSPDIDDEPGINIATTGIFNMLEANPADVILLHIGTNDLMATSDTSGADVQTILTEINRWEDTGINRNPVSVVLARIIDMCVNLPTDCGPGNADVITFNNNIAAIATALTPANGPDEIIIINQRASLLNGGVPDKSLYGNALHPNAAGYDLMAAKWQENLNGTVNAPSILEKCP